MVDFNQEGRGTALEFPPQCSTVLWEINPINYQFGKLTG